MYHEFSGARVYNTNSTVTVNASTVLAVTFNAVHYDTGGQYHWDTNHTERLYAPYDGYYLLHWNVNWVSSTSGYRIATIHTIDHTTGALTVVVTVTRRTSGGNPDLSQTATTVVKMKRGDYATFNVQHSLASATQIKRVTTSSPEAQMQLIGVDYPPEEFQF